MPKFVTRAAVGCLVWIATHAIALQAIAPPAAWGADHDLPVLNTVGRFFGVGYTQGGYHAVQDGRLNAVSSRHRAADYRQGGLPPYAQPPYTTPQFFSAAGPLPTLAPEFSQAGPQAAAPVAAAAPTAPSQPPPGWLEEYLQHSQADRHRELPPPQQAQPQQTQPQESAPRRAEQPEDLAPQPSPSDLLFQLPPASQEVGQEAGFSILDTGFPVPVFQAPARSTATPPTNRYR